MCIYVWVCVIIAFVLELGVVRAVARLICECVCVGMCCGLCGSLATRSYAHVVMSRPDRVGQLLKLIGNLC